ncbi:hypothetical protein RI367_004001 [Sorochytrium milnesiophthora]
MTASTDAPAAAQDFLTFVNASPSPFHAVAEAKRRLSAKGFTEIKESQTWRDELKPNGKYFFTRNSSSIIAFVVGGKFQPGSGGFTMVAAHTDSPCLKVKPVSRKEKSGFAEVGVQLYGGGLWHTWFDRDLSIAGRVMVEESSGEFKQHLVRIARPILRVPTLAIHLDRAVNTDGFKFNNETQLAPVLCTIAKQELSYPVKDKSEKPKHHPVLLDMIAKELKCSVSAIHDFELCLFDTQPSTIGGALNEFIFSPRLDNLMMSYTSIEALLRAAADKSHESDTNVSLVALFDNEEVGSLSAYGADSHFLESTLRRITSAFGTPNNSSSAFEESVHRSYLVSADMAHCIHPNYADKHEENHQPMMNKGVVIKINANQRYATTAPTSLLLRRCAAKYSVPLQEFVVRNDSPCGSTIGPILSGKLGLRTIDVGNPQLSMHSIREQCGTEDVEYAIQLFKGVFEEFAKTDVKVLVD